MAADGRNMTSHAVAFQLGIRGPKLLLRHAQPHDTVCRGAIGEDKALTGKG
jgi:hypothetical protein